MHCPRCGHALRDTEYEGAIINTCDNCGGELLGPEALRHIVDRREHRFQRDLMESIAGRRPSFGFGAPESHAPRDCPACGGLMIARNYAGDSGVIVDRCEECEAIFLDHEELERIQITLERWEDEAPAQIRAIAREVETARREAAEGSSRVFAGSRFAFVNAVINRLLDAA